MVWLLFSVSLVLDLCLISAQFHLFQAEESWSVVPCGSRPLSEPLLVLLPISEEGYGDSELHRVFEVQTRHEFVQHRNAINRFVLSPVPDNVYVSWF